MMFGPRNRDNGRSNDAAMTTNDLCRARGLRDSRSRDHDKESKMGNSWAAGLVLGESSSILFGPDRGPTGAQPRSW